jgi:glycosyltransferase involved in cell wall biosynthesis
LISPNEISVILSTYNAPAWLEKSLWGYACQTIRPREVIIADDGSDSRTAAVLSSIRKRTGLVVKHVWHEDDGFRKCTILNRSIERVEGEYLIFSDGDCIPRHDFVAVHRQFAERGYYLSGGYNKLPMQVSRQITLDDISAGDAFAPLWLRKNGLRVDRTMLRLFTRGRWASILNATTTTRPTWNGHNASGWKTDLYRVNGFDERMRYGAEDCEMGDRLVNVGVKPKQIRFKAICVHLDHARGYVNAADWKYNQQIRRNTRTTGCVKTMHGINAVSKAA